ncbi:S41 family peptidase [Brackiella oedipodis]|uniref:S41 family peptidase n=1 Tax=Brackiella oedipodis TaxID=124225 RepID=UPI000684EDB0|nr:S41 family peptidase [Brackiella oedipodis]
MCNFPKKALALRLSAIVLGTSLISTGALGQNTASDADSKAPMSIAAATVAQQHTADAESAQSSASANQTPQTAGNDEVVDGAEPTEVPAADDGNAAPDDEEGVFGETTVDPAANSADEEMLKQVLAQPDGENSDESLPYEDLRRFALVFAAVKNRYVEPVNDNDLVDSAIRGMLSDLDPHSSYLDKEDYEDLQESTEGEFGGLGIEISERDNHILQIIAPIEGSPADKAGILPGDQIVQVNDTVVTGQSMTEVTKQLRGEPGTSIRLLIKRQGHEDPLPFTIKRDLVKIRSVRSKMLPSQIAYVRISQFQEQTVKDLVQQLKDFKSTPKALVLDLRNNPGGLLNAAVGVVGAFIKEQSLVVYTKNRSQTGIHYRVVPGDYSLDGKDSLQGLPKWTRKVPLVVLINVGSASASEIVAGALQDYQRGRIMGNRSFGKGSVQVVMPLDQDTGIKLTVARYYTPKDRSIQATGIKPDITVSDTAEGDLFSLPREADLHDHLSNDTLNLDKDHSQVNHPSKVGPLDPADLFDFGSEQDFQLHQAVNYLRHKKVNPGKPQHFKYQQESADDAAKNAKESKAPLTQKPAQSAAQPATSQESQTAPVQKSESQDDNDAAKADAQTDAQNKTNHDAMVDTPSAPEQKNEQSK